MNKQLLRLKRRSNDTLLQVAESDDSNNLYVNVAASTPIDIDGGTIDEVAHVTNVDGVDEVSHVTNVDSVDVVSKAVMWGDGGDDYGQHPVFINDQGALYMIDAQEGFLGAEGVFIWPANSAANTVKFIDIPSHIYDNHRTWLGYILNASSTAFTIRVQNKWTTVTGTTAYAQVDEHTIPAATLTSPSATAWTSCFTSIGGVLVDESADWNDDNAANDVPFTFGAVDDAIYFGHTAPFRGVQTVIGTPGVYNATGIWEYWNGSAWTALTVQSTYPVGASTIPFKGTGFLIGFDMEDDWALYDIAGNPTSQYWIRWRVTNFTSMTTGPALNVGKYILYSDVLSATYPFEYAMNSGDVRLLIYNNTQITTIPIPIYYQLRSV